MSLKKQWSFDGHILTLEMSSAAGDACGRGIVEDNKNFNKAVEILDSNMVKAEPKVQPVKGWKK